MDDKLIFRDMQKILMDELRLMHYPIAVKFIFTDEELEEFMKDASYYEPVRPVTFCQCEVAARMKGQTVLGTKEKLVCSNAIFNFGWKPLDEVEVKAHLKYTRDMDQALRFVKSKPRLPEGTLKVFVVSPLADTYFIPDTVHFYCDSMQAYHLLVDYMAATDVHPLRLNQMVSSAACGGNIFSYLEKSANMVTPCSGSYNAGKTERGEINVIIPGKHIEAVVKRLAERIRDSGSSSLTRPGDHFPGADICKNCSVIVFKIK